MTADNTAVCGVTWPGEAFGEGNPLSIHVCTMPPDHPAPHRCHCGDHLIEGAYDPEPPVSDVADVSDQVEP